MTLGLYDIPLYDKRFMGRNPRAWINKKMAHKRRIEERPIGNKLIPSRIHNIMRNTVAYADPKIISQEFSKDHEKLYPDGQKAAEELSQTPGLPEQGRMQQEALIGTLRSKNLTEYEFLARMKITKSLVKLIKKLTARMRIVLLLDHEETRVKEKKYFKDRLETQKAILLEEMNERIPNEKECIKAAVRKERAYVIGKTKDLIEEEAIKVRKVKENYLDKAYTFQMNWQFKNVGDYYQRKINEYSKKWAEQYQELLKCLSRELSLPEEVTEESHFKTLEVLVQQINNEWKDNIINNIDEFGVELGNVRNELKRYDKLIAFEKLKIKHATEIINTSNSIVKNIVEQYEKMVVYAFKGTPGWDNYFLSYAKLIELHNQFIQKAWERKKPLKRELDLPENEEVEEEKDVQISADPSSSEIDQFKHCRDIAKTNFFRTNVLKVKNLIDEVRCAVLKEPFQVREQMSDKSVELAALVSAELKPSDSMYIVDKMTDAYRLLENELCKSYSPQEILKPGISEDGTVVERVQGVVRCLGRHPHLLSSFAGV